MKNHLELIDDPVLEKFLEAGILQISGKIDKETHEYVDTAINISEAYRVSQLLLRINSEGGCLHSSLFIHDLLKSYSNGVVGIIIGTSMSGGNLIIQGCRDRLATRNSLILVHELSFFAELQILKQRRKAEEQLKEHTLWQNKVYSIYEARTGKSRGVLQKIFAKEETLSVEEAKRLKFIDRIVSADELASMMRQKLKKSES